MIEDFVTYDQAMRLKELKFNDLCFAWFAYDQELGIPMISYDKEGKLMHDFGSQEVNNSEILTWQRKNIHTWAAAPLIDNGIRWFRKLGFFAYVYCSADLNKFYYIIVKDPARLNQKLYSDKDEQGNTIYFLSEREAQLACMDKLIEMAFIKIANPAKNLF